MKDMATLSLADIILVLQTAEAPSDPEWDEFVAALRAFGARLPQVRVLVFTDGGGPTTMQRARVIELCAATGYPRVAVVSDSLIVRSAIRIFRWFGATIECVSPARAEEAYAFLGLTPPEREMVRRLIPKLRAGMGDPRLYCVG
jgi:hypothetical protein